MIQLKIRSLAEEYSSSLDFKIVNELSCLDSNVLRGAFCVSREKARFLGESHLLATYSIISERRLLGENTDILPRRSFRSRLLVPESRLN